MKKTNYIYIPFVICLLLVLFSCKKDKLKIYTLEIKNEYMIKDVTSVKIIANYSYPTKLESVKVLLSGNANMINATFCNASIEEEQFVASFTDLQANTDYYYQYEYSNGIDIIKTNVKNFKTEDYDLPTVVTADIENITGLSAICGGNVTSAGNGTIMARGVCWSTSQNPTIHDFHTSDGTGTGTFTSSLNSLSTQTIYYVRAYATNNKGTSYGDQKSFTTQDGLPIVITSEVTNITAITAICGGNVTYDGGFDITERGVCWSTYPNPTVNNAHTTDGGGTGLYVSEIIELELDTKYYVRAYAINEKGANYGTQKELTTLNGVPTITTYDATNITTTSATLGGNVTSDGGFDIIAKGLCWSTNNNPTIDDLHTTESGGTGTYSFNISGLNEYETYYVRAYAINILGETYYGNEKNFTTPITGSINSFYSVSTSKQVYFSQGNLQYQASTNTWRFSDNQWDIIGSDNVNISSSYNGWIDLFGWGTSGYNHGAVCYQPYSTSQTNSDYYAYGSSSYNLNDQTGNADWGYNAISNGGNVENLWRTLTCDEWVYVFNKRSTNSGIRYAKAEVANVKGVILLPDDWSCSTYNLNNTNSNVASYTTNIITASDWAVLENAGAVFLPTSGYRNGNETNYVGSNGNYWSASCGNSNTARGMWFNDSSFTPSDWNSRIYGRSVRLVCPTKN